ncbi:MAG: hypothetical protein M0R03_17440 [Novosphingobium sp.]|nr:hypothetical protein [Novosphingobium sp.]
MRYLILENIRGYKLVDISKGGLNRQERYVINEEGIIQGTVKDEFSDPLEAISELLILNSRLIKKQIMEEVKNERY